jgi:hypothetical protein
MKFTNWLLLLYTLPTKRTSARVNLWRRLKKFGAVQLKTSAYVLPDDPIQYERFQWLAKEIRDAAGDAILVRVAEIEGTGNDEIVELFNQARAIEYGEVARGCRAACGDKAERNEKLRAEVERLQRRFREIKEVDYFKSSAADDAQMALRRLERAVAPRKGGPAPPPLEREKFKGQTWVTRPRPGIDRAGSAWLIRRFIDPKARFTFATDALRFPKALPFDIADVEFSHHGDDCTFETLVKRFGITDKAVRKIAEMVHDADLEDGKFQRCECIGINRVLAGWEKNRMGDVELLAKGIECFEGLYQELEE